MSGSDFVDSYPISDRNYVSSDLYNSLTHFKLYKSMKIINIIPLSYSYSTLTSNNISHVTVHLDTRSSINKIIYRYNLNIQSRR